MTNYRPHLLVGESTIQDELLLDSVWQSASIFPTFNLFSDSSKNASVLWHFPLPSKLPTPSELLSSELITITTEMNIVDILYKTQI